MTTLDAARRVCEAARRTLAPSPARSRNQPTARLGLGLAKRGTRDSARSDSRLCLFELQTLLVQTPDFCLFELQTLLVQTPDFACSGLLLASPAGQAWVGSAGEAFRSSLPCRRRRRSSVARRAACRRPGRLIRVPSPAESGVDERGRGGGDERNPEGERRMTAVLPSNAIPSRWEAILPSNAIRWQAILPSNAIRRQAILPSNAIRWQDRHLMAGGPAIK